MTIGNKNACKTIAHAIPCGGFSQIRSHMFELVVIEREQCPLVLTVCVCACVQLQQRFYSQFAVGYVNMQATSYSCYPTCTNLTRWFDKLNWSSASFLGVGSESLIETDLYPIPLRQLEVVFYLQS